MPDTGMSVEKCCLPKPFSSVHRLPLIDLMVLAGPQRVNRRRVATEPEDQGFDSLLPSRGTRCRAPAFIAATTTPPTPSRHSMTAERVTVALKANPQLMVTLAKAPSGLIPVMIPFR